MLAKAFGGLGSERSGLLPARGLVEGVRIDRLQWEHADRNERLLIEGGWLAILADTDHPRCRT